MITEVDKKVDFILDWYKKERIRFSFAKQIMLAKTWIDICTKNEEYEMAAALHKEKENTIQEYLKNKRKNRTCKQGLKYFYVKLKRKFR